MKRRLDGRPGSAEPSGASSQLSPPAVLVTGGAGFIGAHVTSELLAHGYRVRVLDDLVAQVHGERSDWPSYLEAPVERIRGDVRDSTVLRDALDGVGAVIHLAARVGVGQSMYRIKDYVDTNSLGTAILLGQLIDRKIDRLVVASSMSIYGEGAYMDGRGRPVAGVVRSPDRLHRGQWEARGPRGEALRARPTDETQPPDLASVYALSKFDQEQLCLLIGDAYGIPTLALRLFNVYGRHQALSNPYTGVLAIFGSRLLNGRPPFVFEDGFQRRDFVHVSDVARAFRLALQVPEPPVEDCILNIASGESFTVRDVAIQMAEGMNSPHLQPEITGRFRRGDVRHCFADISRARRVLGFEPVVRFEDGLADLVDWLATQQADDRMASADRELRERGLLR